MNSGPKPNNKPRPEVNTRPRANAMADTVSTRPRANAMTSGIADAGITRPRANAMVSATGRESTKSVPPVLQNMSSAQRKNLESNIGQGPGKMQHASTERMHTERAHVYDQMSKGKRMQTFNNFKTGLNPLNTISKEDRRNLTTEANQLKPYKARMKEHNKDATKREKIGTNLGHVKTAATVANYVGTGVTLVNPAAGAAVKLAAKGTGLAANLGSAAAYHSASKKFADNVDESATRINMLDSHISAEKSDLTATKRNKALVSSAASLAFTGAGIGLDSALDSAGDLTRNLVKGGFDAGKTGSKKAVGMAFSRKVRDNKSEIVNLMRHQKAFEPKTELIQTRPQSNAVIEPQTRARSNAVTEAPTRARSNAVTKR